MMNRFSKPCWLAVALALFSMGQSQWLSSGSLGVGRACAEEIEDEDIGEDEPHLGGNQGTGSLAGTNQTGDDDSRSGGTTSGGSITRRFLQGSSVGGHTVVNVGNIDGMVNTPGGGFDSLDIPGSGGSVGGSFGTFFFVGFTFDDGNVDPADYTIWANNFGVGTTFGQGDFNADGVVDSADYSIWANNFGTDYDQGASGTNFGIPEVFDIPELIGGGTVDSADYSIWANNFGSTLSPQRTVEFYYYVDLMDAGDYTDWANHFGQSGDGIPGDFNTDGTVDIVDKLEWDRHFGEVYIPTIVAGAAAVRGASLTAAVPEPSSLALAALALFALAAFARLTRRRSK